MSKRDREPSGQALGPKALPTTPPDPARRFLAHASPGILRLRSQVLPMLAMEGACRRRVMLSFIRPSPVTFTVKGLPVREAAGRAVQTTGLWPPGLSPPSYNPGPYRARACLQT